MINWKWWQSKDKSDTNTIISDVMENIVNDTEPNKQYVYDLSVFELSEPVTSFIKCFKEKPRRFKMKETTYGRSMFGRKTFNFTDKVTNQTWYISVRPKHIQDLPSIEGADWMTVDERTALTIVLSLYYSDRETKLSKIKGDKIQRLKEKERDRLTKIYKTD